MNRQYSHPILTLLFAGIAGSFLGVHRVPAERTVLPDPIELGAVRWRRSLEEGIRLAQASGQPILILFQEVPGCGTCRKYGDGPLSHPMIVEAIVDLFVPVAILNSRDGSDRMTLEAIGEAPRKNPVVRIINTNRKELAPRLSGDYTKRGLVIGTLNLSSAWQQALASAAAVKDEPGVILEIRPAISLPDA